VFQNPKIGHDFLSLLPCFIRFLELCLNIYASKGRGDCQVLTLIGLEIKHQGRLWMWQRGRLKLHPSIPLPPQSCIIYPWSVSSLCYTWYIDTVGILPCLQHFRQFFVICALGPCWLRLPVF